MNRIAIVVTPLKLMSDQLLHKIIYKPESTLVKGAYLRLISAAENLTASADNDYEIVLSWFTPFELSPGNGDNAINGSVV